MSFALHIQPIGNQFAATLVGVPNVQVIKDTRSQAVEALQTLIGELMSRGDLILYNPKQSLKRSDEEPISLMALAGKFKDDETLDEIVAEAYALRDAEAVEFW